MSNFSSLARLEVPEKFVWWVGGGVCKVIFMSNPTVVLRLGWGFDNKDCIKYHEDPSFKCGDICKTILAFVYSLIFNVFCIFPQFGTSKDG